MAIVIQASLEHFKGEFIFSQGAFPQPAGLLVVPVFTQLWTAITVGVVNVCGER